MAPVQPLSPTALAAWLDDPSRPRPLLLDVREPWEYATCHLDRAALVPMREIAERWSELDLEVPIVCICHHGARSMQVAAFLSTRGAADIHNLTGGLAAWTREVDPGFPTY